jgi:hypothetical protein
MAINRQNFAVMCVEQAMLFGVNPHFLVAVAELLSGINDDSDGERIGPFRRTAAQWQAGGTAPEFQVALTPDDIKRPRMQCTFAALQTFRAQEQFAKANKDQLPSALDLYKIWPNDPVPAGKSAQGALDSTRDLIEPAEKEALEGLDLGNLVGPIKLNFLKPEQQAMALKIIDGFKAAGCTVIAQAAALANAMAESRLNPNAVSKPPEHSVGLFQCNIKGVGAGKSDAFLMVPENNIALIIAEMNRRAPQFKKATDLTEAVKLFVKEVERPADATGEATRRMAFALKFLPA